MALFRRPASPVEGRTSTAKKVAAASVGKYEVGAIETKIAVAEPKVEKPYVKNPTKPIAPDAKAASETKENKMPGRKKVEAKKPAEKEFAKSVAPAAAEPAKAAAEKKAPAKKAPAKAAAEKKAPAKKAAAAKAPAKAAAAKKTTAAKKAPAKATAAKKTTAAKKAPAKVAAAKKSASLFQIEFGGNNITADAIEAKLAEEIKARGIKAKNVEIYVKPEENMVYTVVDGNQVDFPLF